MARPTLLYLNSNKLHYYPLMVSLGKYNRSFNTFDDLSSRACAPNKTEDLNLCKFNMTIKIIESKTLKKAYFKQL